MMPLVFSVSFSLKQPCLPESLPLDQLDGEVVREAIDVYRNAQESLCLQGGPFLLISHLLSKGLTMISFVEGSWTSCVVNAVAVMAMAASRVSRSCSGSRV